MVTRIHSFLLRGIEAAPCEVEADLSPVGMPKTTIVGLPDAAVKESGERVRTALLNSGFDWPQMRVTVNLAPADLRKEGPVYDLPVAIAILSAAGFLAADARIPRLVPAGESPEAPSPSAPAHGSGPVVLRADLHDWIVAGELALDGRLRPVRGVVSMAMLAREQGRRGVIVPAANGPEAAVVGEIEVRSAERLAEVVDFLLGRRELALTPSVELDALVGEATAEVDFGDVRGQEAAKRALVIAAAGGHNALLIGPAGTGKTMMARALPGILPPLTREEALEVTRVHSCRAAAQVGSIRQLVTRRPVRTPHHTASTAAIVGGGPVPRPGEVSLAHRGVLFLDELPEFSRVVLEALREPLEDGHVTIARASAAVRFPARFMLVAAMNPTQQGGGRVAELAGDPRERYLARLSGPLVDRIDIHVEVPTVPFRQLATERRGTDSAAMRARVDAARARQRARQESRLNAELAGRLLDRHARLDDAGAGILGAAMRDLGLSARAYDKVRRLARSIADLEGAERIAAEHVAEAVQYRLLDRRR